MFLELLLPRNYSNKWYQSRRSENVDSAAHSNSVCHVILETDAVLVQQAIVTYSHAHSPVAGLIVEIKDLVASNLLSFCCAFIPHIGNCAAHEMAVLGLSRVEGAEHISCDVPKTICVIVEHQLIKHTRFQKKKKLFSSLQLLVPAAFS